MKLMLIAIVLATFTLFVIGHEATHLLLSNQPTGICIGYCQGNHAQLVGIGLAYGEHNAISRNELIAHAGGLIVALGFLFPAMREALK